MDKINLIIDGNPNPAALTHDDYLAIITRSRLTGQQLDLAAMLTDEAKKMLQQLFVDAMGPEIEQQRAAVAKYDKAANDLQKG